ncbi:MAG: hypothetical protein AAF570_07320 [Bacteroidota bacterium]
MMVFLKAYFPNTTPTTSEAHDYLIESFCVTIGQVNRMHYRERKKKVDATSKYGIMRINSMYYLMSIMMGLYDNFYERFVENDVLRRALMTEGGIVIEGGEPDILRFGTICRALENRPQVVPPRVGNEVLVRSLLAIEEENGIVTGKDLAKIENYFSKVLFWPGVGMHIPEHARVDVDFTKIYPSVALRGTIFDNNSKGARRNAGFFFSEVAFHVIWEATDQEIIFINGKPVDIYQAMREKMHIQTNGPTVSANFTPDDSSNDRKENYDLMTNMMAIDETRVPNQMGFSKATYVYMRQGAFNALRITSIKEPISKSAFKDFLDEIITNSNLNGIIDSAFGPADELTFDKIVKNIEAENWGGVEDPIKQHLQSCILDVRNQLEQRYYPPVDIELKDRIPEQSNDQPTGKNTGTNIDKSIEITDVAVRIPFPPERPDSLFRLKYKMKGENAGANEVVLTTC